MAAASAVDISSLSESAIRYQKDLQMLPYATMAPVLGQLGITLYPGIQNKDVMTNFLRENGIAKPYVSGASLIGSDIGKVEQKTLEIHLAFANVKDNIQNYKTVTVGPDVLLGKNQSKQHPWQVVMLSTIVKTFAEDVLDALYNAIRNTSTQTPMGLFNGYNKLIDDAITADEILIGKDNKFSTGVLSSSNAYTQLEAMYKACHPMLRNRPSIMVMPYLIGDMYDADFFEEYKYKPVMDNFGRQFIQASNGLCQIVRTPYLSGQRVYITVPGNFHFGMDSMADQNFVQVRSPYEDPNDVQFWIQAGYGTRIQSFHRKVFMVNDQNDSSVLWSGDDES
jgi:hypothetical protein